MEELKTLKDLEEDIAGNTSIESDSRHIVIYPDRLRQNVIKWIHVIEEKIRLMNKLESEPQSPLQKIATRGLDEVLDGQKRVLMDLHNITEEDLK